jgi:hypothetical protein
MCLAMLARPSTKTIAFGMIGGLAGTVLMDLVMVTTFVLVGEPGDAFFAMVGEKLGDGVILGIVVHNAIGLSGGLVFALLVLGVARMNIDSRKKGLTYGLAAGALTIPLGCIPMAIWLGQPILEVLAFSLLPHLTWGLTLGWTMAFGLLNVGAESVPARSG